jgi:hypothetical protein
MSKSRLRHPNNEGQSLGRFLKKRERYLHVSCNAWMIDNPEKVLAEKNGGHFFGPLKIPYIQKGVSYAR